MFFKEGVTEERILEIKSTVELRDEVASVRYVSDDEAWEEFSGENFSEDLMTNLEGVNPLEGLSNLEISLSDTSKQADLVSYLESFEEVDHVNSLDSVAESFTDISRLVSYVALGIIVILILVAIFLISNTVRIGIAVRKEEIAIMKIHWRYRYFCAWTFPCRGYCDRSDRFSYPGGPDTLCLR